VTETFKLNDGLFNLFEQLKVLQVSKKNETKKQSVVQMSTDQND
jgi:hypothetical protein